MPSNRFLMVPRALVGGQDALVLDDHCAGNARKLTAVHCSHLSGLSNRAAKDTKFGIDPLAQPYPAGWRTPWTWTLNQY